MKIKPNSCPHCGDRLKKIAGIWRCEKDQYNAPFENYLHEQEKFGRLDNRPYNCLTGKIDPIIKDE